MKALDVAAISKEDARLLKKAAFAAGLIEFTVLTLLGVHEHWLAHPQRTKGVDESKYIAAEVFQIPKESHLVDNKSSPVRTKEVALSKNMKEDKKNAPRPQPVQDENQADAGDPVGANHGPVAVVAPPPVIPGYLQDKDLNSSVVVEFLVNNQGLTTVRLIGSSGNEELDAIALETVKQWQFRPAEANHRPIDAKVRLRINFDVH